MSVPANHPNNLKYDPFNDEFTKYSAEEWTTIMKTMLEEHYHDLNLTGKDKKETWSYWLSRFIGWASW